MGTKVQSKSYFQGHCSMKDLNEDAESGNWPLFYEDQLLKNRQYYNNGFLPRPATEGHLDHDKEMLKRTMLEHEAIFRNQVFELHRLYRTQRDMMDELKKKEVLQYPEASQINYFTAQMPSEHVQNTSLLSNGNVPFMSSGCSRPSYSGTDSRQSPLNFSKENSTQFESVATQNGTFNDCKFPESNSAKLPRRTFDLQLPADQYIDSEEGEQIDEDKVSQTSAVAPDTDVKLSLGNVGNPKYLAVASNSDACVWNKHSLADLNHPVEVEEAASSSHINNILRPVACNGGIQGQYLPMKQNSGSLGSHRDFFHRAHVDKRIDIDALRAENVGTGREWQPYGLEAGQTRSKLNSFSQGFGVEKFHTASRQVQAEFNSTQFPAFLLGDKNKRHTWKESGIGGSEIPQRSQGLPNHSFSRSVELPLIQSPYPLVPDVAESASSFYSSWRNPTRSLSRHQMAVQALPCFNGSAQSNKGHKVLTQNPGIIEPQWHHDNHSKLNSSFGSVVSYQNGHSHGPQFESSASQVRLPSAGFDYPSCRNDYTSTSEYFENRCATKFSKGSNCIDVKSAKDFNLNLAIPNGSEEMVPQRDVVIIDGEGKTEDTVGGLPWLMKKPACNGLAKGREASNEVGFDLMKAYHQNSTLKEKVPSPSFIRDSASTSSAPLAEERIQGGQCSSSNKLLGFPIFDKSHTVKDVFSQSSSSKSHQNPSEVEATMHSNGKVGGFNIDLSCDPVLPDSVQKESTENLDVTEKLYKEVSGFKNNFNLNSCAEDEEPLACSGPEIKFNIDLEAPAVPESAEDTSPEEESQHDHPKTPAESSQVEVQDPSEDLERIAAETIVSFFSSSGVDLRLDNASCDRPETPLRESLNWFAEIASSCTKDLDIGKNGVILRGSDSNKGDECDSDSSGYFERMTMNIIETKEDEYWCTRPWALETQKEEEPILSSVPTRRRRGQARRGRQRRDFQRDILPGLASLSRHEVTSDIQTIGGLMKADGQTWESRLARRNGARNGWARGRRRPRNPAPAVVATVTCSPPKQKTNTCEPGLGTKSLKGWGKTTRRPRRPRVAAGNAPL